MREKRSADKRMFFVLLVVVIVLIAFKVYQNSKSVAFSPDDGADSLDESSEEPILVEEGVFSSGTGEPSSGALGYELPDHIKCCVCADAGKTADVPESLNCDDINVCGSSPGSVVRQASGSCAQSTSFCVRCGGSSPKSPKTIQAPFSIDQTSLNTLGSAYCNVGASNLQSVTEGACT